MATIYVWSGATGAADGTTKADAYTTLQTALTNWTTADVIFVHVGTTPHSESDTADVTYTASNSTRQDPVPIYAVDADSSDVYLISTSVNFDSSGNAADYTFDLHCHIFGLQWTAGRRIFTDGNFDIKFTDCRLETNGGGAASNGAFVSNTLETSLELIGTDIILDSSGNASTVEISVGSSTFVMRGGSITGNPDGALFLNDGATGGGPGVTLDAVDLSGITGVSLFDFVAGGSPFEVRLNNCKIASGVTVAANLDMGGDLLELNNCDDGSAIYRTERYGYRGDSKTDTSVTRNWSDESGNTTGSSVSHAITPASVSAPHLPIQDMPLTKYVGSTGSKTFTVELLVGDGSTGTSKKLEQTVTVNNVGYFEIVVFLGESTLSGIDDNNCWMEVRYLGTSGETLYALESTRNIQPDGTGSALTAGSGGWSGTTTNNVLYVDPEVTVA